MLRRAARPRCMERGTTLIEVLVSLLIIAIMSLGVMKNSVVAMRASKLTELNHAASSLAISKIEELAAIDTQNLDATFSATETDVAWGGVETTFTRVTSVVVNANDSRDVSVTVSSNSSLLPTTVAFETTFVPWE